MISSEILRKADAALDVIIKHDEEDSDCSFKQVLQEILERWRSNN